MRTREPRCLAPMDHRNIYNSPPPPLDAYHQSVWYGEPQPHTDRDPARAAHLAACVTALPGVGISTPPLAFVRARSRPVALGSYAMPPGAANTRLAPVSWPSTYYDSAVGPVYVSTYPLALSSSPPTSRMTSRSSCGGESTAHHLSPSIMPRGGLALAPGPPPGFRLGRTITSSSTLAAAAPLAGSGRSSRGPRGGRGDDKAHSSRKGGRAKSAGVASDTTTALVQAKSSGVSEWHMITAGGGDDDDGPPQPRDPLGPKRYSKYYQ